MIRIGLAAAVLAAASSSAATLSRPTTFYGMCDASAAVALSDELFAVANDEDNILRIFNRRTGGLPVQTLDVGPFLHAGKKGNTETDIEGAARVADTVFWITSHGCDAKGRPSPTRERFFATRIVTNAGAVTLMPFGRAYNRMRIDLERDPRLKAYDLASAGNLAPKLPGALNIEGLCSTPEGHLLIGFRNPIRRGLALMVPLRNPAAVITGAAPEWGEPLALDLGGLGIRSVGRLGTRYLIIAGPFDAGGSARLFTWEGGKSAPQLFPDAPLDGLNPEGLDFMKEGGQMDFLILSDDGTRKLGGLDCKSIKDPAARQFRGYILTP